MATTNGADAQPQLPEGFIQELELLVPKELDAELHRLLRVQPFSTRIAARLCSHAARLNGEQSAGLTALIEGRYRPAYDAAH